MPITDPQLLYPYFKIRWTVTLVMSTVGLLLASEPRRVALILYNNSASGINIWGDATVTMSTGLQIAASGLSSAGAPLAFWFRDYGALVQHEWYAIASSDNSTLSLIEVLWQPPEG